MSRIGADPAIPGRPVLLGGENGFAVVARASDDSLDGWDDGFGDDGPLSITAPGAKDSNQVILFCRRAYRFPGVLQT